MPRKSAHPGKKPKGGRIRVPGKKEVLHMLANVRERMRQTACRIHWHALGYGRRLRSEKGQGTTEYAILVGVLVVIAILAITVFRPKIEELWQAISDGINGL